MADPEHNILRFVGSPAGLQAAVEFTAAETGFIPALIEKDYWCSVVSAHWMEVILDILLVHPYALGRV